MSVINIRMLQIAWYMARYTKHCTNMSDTGNVILFNVAFCSFCMPIDFLKLFFNTQTVHLKTLIFTLFIFSIWNLNNLNVELNLLKCIIKN